MGREYRIVASVTDKNAASVDAAEDALENYNGFDFRRKYRADWGNGESHLVMQGDGEISNIERMSHEIRVHVWKTIQGFVPIDLDFIDLERGERMPGEQKEFERLRELGLLNPECGDCGDPLPFGTAENARFCERCQRLNDEAEWEAKP